MDPRIYIAIAVFLTSPIALVTARRVWRGELEAAPFSDPVLRQMPAGIVLGILFLVSVIALAVSAGAAARVATTLLLLTAAAAAVLLPMLYLRGKPRCLVPPPLRSGEASAPRRDGTTRR